LHAETLPQPTLQREDFSAPLPQKARDGILRHATRARELLRAAERRHTSAQSDFKLPMDFGKVLDAVKNSPLRVLRASA
jgi:hypothetical protein